MNLRRKLLNDATGFAGLAFSATQGLREEIKSVIRTQVDEMISSLNLVRREELEVVEAIACKARQNLSDLELRITELETRLKDR